MIGVQGLCCITHPEFIRNKGLLGSKIGLFEIKNKLDKIIKREGKTNLANACFKFLSTRVEFDLMGWQEKDIFQHK